MPESKPPNPLRRLLGMPGRTKLLLAVGVLLVIVFTTRSCSGVNIGEEQAVVTARAALAADPGAFVPGDTETKVLRQGFPPAPFWVVVFTVPDPDGDSKDFLHHAAVWVDARSGEVRQINVSAPDGG